MIINNTFISVNEYKTDKSDTVLIITHGLAEYSKHYDEFANFFMNKGINVITYDLRGHGRSLGKRGYVRSYKDYLSDLDEIVLYARKSNKKVFLLGHSMGGLLTNLYVQKYKGVDGVIISSSPSNYVKKLSTFRFLPLRFLFYKKRLFTNFKDSKLGSNPMTKDSFDLDCYYLRLPIQVLIKGMKKFRRCFDKYTTPVLFIHGERDVLVNSSDSLFTYNNIKSVDKEIKLYQESKHNILSDIEKDKVYLDIEKWINDRL
ncbi:MAG: alpha/beta fold hydrolase [Acholeplasma sp.]|nr:alpha/beta fold hydrolase [Acholeplasma sp.]